MKQLTVKVTNKHIRRAAKLNPNRKDPLGDVDETSCPLALAISEKTGLKTWVSNDSIRVGGDGWLDAKVLFKPSKKSKRYMDKFDEGKYIKPDTFTFKFDEYDFVSLDY
jgi:hypothetical protein